MRKMWLSIGLASLLAPPAFAQDKEADRVQSAGKVIQVRTDRWRQSPEGQDHRRCRSDRLLPRDEG
jgi:hypothetical protein